MPGVKVDGWEILEKATFNFDSAESSLLERKDQLNGLLSISQGLGAIADGLDSALQELYERIQRLHQKIDRIEKKLGSV